MKKTVSMLLLLAMVLSLGVCTAYADDKAPAETNHFEALNIVLTPSGDPEEMLTETQYLPAILKQEMETRGYYIDKINVKVAGSYDEAGQALSKGEADISWLPAGTYAANAKDCAVILKASRKALSNDSDDPASWNGEDNKTHRLDDNTDTYKALILATSTDYGKTLASKVEKGEKLSWEELDKARWAVQKTTSSAGYIYPSMWMMENYDGNKISDLSNVIPVDGYREAVRLAADGKADVILTYADARLDYEYVWTNVFNHDKAIWDELKVIAVTKDINNDTVSISKASQFYTPSLAKALQSSIISIIDSNIGKELFKTYSHDGYMPASDEDYKSALEAQSVVKHVDEADMVELSDSDEGEGDTVETVPVDPTHSIKDR